MSDYEFMQAEGIKGKCSFCGDNATAWWRGIHEIFICRECAINTLPRLYIDALGKNELKNVYRFSDELLKEVYRGAIFRLTR